MSVETVHGSAHANQSMAKSSKQMIEVAPKGTTGQIRMNRQVTQTIWKMSSNTRKIPETTGKQPSKKGQLKCYECGQKGHMRPQCPKLRSRRIAAVREDNLEEIAENIEGNLKEDAEYSVSREEEISQKEEDNLNESSGEDKEMYSWDELVGCIYAPYKVNPNIFQFYFDFMDIFHHPSMHPLFRNIYEFYFIFYYFISSFIVYNNYLYLRRYFPF